MRMKTPREMRLAGNILIGVGILEICVGFLMRSVQAPLYYLPMIIGVVFLFWGRNWRRR